MNVERLRPAIDIVRNRPLATDSRAATYLRTYPALLAAARCDVADNATRFLQLSAMTYGWMPRVLRLDANYLDKAISVFRRAGSATETDWDEQIIGYTAACLRSVVGASKLLHFANPEVFPIWDSNVERIWRGAKPSQHHMEQAANYISYVQDVHETRRACLFPEFFEAFNRAYQDRLVRLRILPYGVTAVRAIEAAAFELANDDEEGS